MTEELVEQITGICELTKQELLPLIQLQPTCWADDHIIRQGVDEGKFNSRNTGSSTTTTMSRLPPEY